MCLVCFFRGRVRTTVGPIVEGTVAGEPRHGHHGVWPFEFTEQFPQRMHSAVRGHDKMATLTFLTDSGEAFKKARDESRLLMVFLHGDFDDEAVDEMEESVWQNEAVLAAAAQAPGVVALKLNADSTGGQQFAQMYPVVSTPSLQLITPPTMQQPGGQVVKIISGSMDEERPGGGVLRAADVATGLFFPCCFTNPPIECIVHVSALAPSCAVSSEKRVMELSPAASTPQDDERHKMSTQIPNTDATVISSQLLCAHTPAAL